MAKDKVGGAINWIRHKLGLGNSLETNDAGRVSNHSSNIAGKKLPDAEPYNPVSRGADGRMFREPPEGIKAGMVRGEAGKISNPGAKGMPIASKATGALAIADIATSIAADAEKSKQARKPENNRSTSYTTPKNTEISAPRKKVSVETPPSDDEIKAAKKNIESITRRPAAKSTPETRARATQKPAKKYVSAPKSKASDAYDAEIAKLHSRTYDAEIEKMNSQNVAKNEDEKTA